MKIQNEWLTKWVARLVVLILKLLFATCRKQFAIYPGTSGYDPELPTRYLYAVWHDVLFFPLAMAKPHHMSALSSRHRDGEYVAEMLRRFCVIPYRGSSRRGGAQAVRKLVDIADQFHITLTPDGPLGPRRTMKEGIVFLASRTGLPIVPAAFTCRRGLRIRGKWTDMLIPLPFTTAYCVLGEPIRVPADLTREQMEAMTREVQEAMDRLYARVEDWAAGRGGRLAFEEATPIRNAA